MKSYGNINKIKKIDMKHLHTFKDFLFEQQLNEIGEGVTPFPFSRSGGSNVDKWAAEMASADRSKNISGNWEELPILTYKFKGDKATYEAKIGGGYSRRVNISFNKKPDAPKSPTYNLIIVIAFDVVGSEKEVITNFGEQFKVLSTVVAITKQVVKEISKIKWVELMEIRIAAKLEDAEEGKPIIQSKRGRFYLEYIKKQGASLPGDWSAEITNDMFVLVPRKITSSRPDKYISLSTVL
jgi:hypothetical protein